MFLYSVLFLPLFFVSVCSTLPHIVFIVVDDLGWRDTGYRYNSDIQLKNIDYLHSIGVDLTSYYVHRVCTPTRSAIMNGRYSWQSGAQKVFTKQTLQHLPFINGINTKILPQYLKENKYKTYMIGKWHVGYAAYNMTPNGRGFDHFYGFQSSGAQNYYTHGGEYLDFWSNYEPKWNAQGNYSTDLYNKRIISYIDNFGNITKKNSNVSLFFYAAFQTVHGPLQDPPDVNTSKTKYSNCDHIANVNRTIFCHKMIDLDNTIGNMIDALKTNNLWNDTVLIFTTDNGGLPFYDNPDGKHEGFSVNLPYRSGKDTLFEGGVHGNSFISGGNYKILPDNLRGKNNSILIHSIDWLPTIIEGILGINIDPNDKMYITGINFWNSIINPSEELNRSTLYIDIILNDGGLGAQQGIIHEMDGIKYKYINGTQSWTLYYPLPPELPYGNMSEINETIFLFNLDQDPYENNNIAQENSDLVGQLQAMINNAVDTMGYMPVQSATKQPDGNPESNPQLNNTWAPWIGSPSN